MRFNNKITILIALFISLVSITLSSCIKEPIDDEPLGEGSIYLKIVGQPYLDEYDDDNDAIPYNFNEGQEYGPCEPGTYHFSFKTHPNANGVYYYLDNATYTLEGKGGTKRVYTLSLGAQISLKYTDM